MFNFKQLTLLCNQLDPERGTPYVKIFRMRPKGEFISLDKTWATSSAAVVFAGSASTHKLELSTMCA